MMQPRFIVMETRRVFVSKPSLMAWIKTAFPLGSAGQGQLLCPYFFISWVHPHAPKHPILTSLHPTSAGHILLVTAQRCSVSLPNPSQPRPTHHEQPGLKHIFLDPSPPCFSLQASRRSPGTISPRGGQKHKIFTKVK